MLNRNRDAHHSALNDGLDDHDDDLLVVEVPTDLRGGSLGELVCKIVRMFRDAEY